MDLLPSSFAAVSDTVKAGNRFWAMGLAALTFPFFVIAEPLTEHLSLGLGLDQTDFVRLQESRIENAQGQLLSTQAWANPEFELSREEAGDETETGVWLRQPIDVSGRRRLDRDSAKMSLHAIEAGNAVQRTKRSAEIRRSFYQALFHQQQQRLLTQWIDKFSNVEADMRKREAAGDVSGYDRLRISRERASLLAQQRISEAEYKAAWQQLLGMIDPDNSRKFNSLTGHLTPGELIPLATMLEQIEQAPELAELTQQVKAAQLNARAVARSHIPGLTLGVGHKTIEGPGTDESGLMLSASMDLPLFDRKTGARQRARAKAIQAESEYQLARQRLNTDIRSLWSKAQQMSLTARSYSEKNVTDSFELVRIAEAAYKANEIGVLELIDAYRTALEAGINALQISKDARFVRIELDAILDGVKL